MVNISKLNKKLLSTLILILIYFFFFKMVLINYANSGFNNGFISKAIDQIYIAYTLDKPYFSYSQWKDTAYENMFYGYSDSFGLTSLICFISQIMNISPISVISLPIGGLVSSLFYFIISNSILKNYLVSFLLTIYFILYSSTTSLTIGYANCWSFVLFLTFMFVLIKLIYKSSDNKDVPFVLILFLSYFGMMSIWHTMEVRGLAFLLSLNLLLYIIKLNDKNSEFKPRVSIMIAFFAMTLVFKELWYRVIPRNGFDALLVSYTSTLSKYVSLFLGDYKYIPKSEFYYMDSGSNLYLYCEIAMLILILVPLILSLLFVDIYSIKTRNIDKPLVFKWSVLISYLILFILYGSQGGAGPGLLFYIFPIISTMSLLQLLNKFHNYSNKTIVLTYLLIVIIIQISMAMIVVNNTSENQLKLNSENAHPSNSWYFEYTPIDNNSSRRTLTDFNTAGFYTISGANKGYLFKYEAWNPRYYQIYLQDKTRFAKHEYVIINYYDFDQPLYMDQGWNRLKPLNIYQSKLFNNKNFNKIYTDNTCIILNST